CRRRDRDGQSQPGGTRLEVTLLAGRVPLERGGDLGVKVEGTKEFDAPAQLVWDVLNDPSRMAQLLPGVESFAVQDDRHWSASVKVPLGMGGLKLNFKFEKTEERPIEYARLSAKGQGVGALVSMDTQFHLAP